MFIGSSLPPLQVRLSSTPTPFDVGFKITLGFGLSVLR